MEWYTYIKPKKILWFTYCKYAKTKAKLIILILN